MPTYALLDGDGNVLNVIEADQEFIDSLPSLIADENTDTGSLNDVSSAFPIDDTTDADGARPGTDHRWEPENGWVLKPEVVEAREAADAAATAAAEQQAARDAEDARIAELRTKVGPDGPGLTQDERDELNLIMLSRMG